MSSHHVLCLAIGRIISLYVIRYRVRQPLRENTHIVSYWFCGAIKGNRIDLYFDSRQDAMNWGMKTVKVTIL